MSVKADNLLIDQRPVGHQPAEAAVAAQAADVVRPPALPLPIVLAAPALPPAQPLPIVLAAPAHVEIAAVGPYSDAALALLCLLNQHTVRFSDAGGHFYLISGHEGEAITARAAAAGAAAGAAAAAPRLALNCREITISNWIEIGASVPGAIPRGVADAMRELCLIFGMPCAVMEPDCAALACAQGGAPGGVSVAALGGAVPHAHRSFILPIDINSYTVLGQIRRGECAFRQRALTQIQLFDAYSAEALTAVLRDTLQMLQIEFAYVWTADGGRKFAVLGVDGFDACCARLGLTYEAPPAALSPEERARAAARAAIVAPEKFVRIARTVAARFEDAVPVLLGSAAGTVAILRRDRLLGA
jgi:hypothetical protein